MRCDGFTGQMRAFCERHAPQGVAEAFHGYQSLRSRCEWARQPAVLRERGVSSSRWQTTAMHERAIVSDTPERSELEDLLPNQTLWTCKTSHADDFTFHIHGDSACMKANRGAECYLLGMPAGYGFRFAAGQIFFNAKVNDLRQPGSPVLSWSVEVGMHVMRNRSATSMSKLFACTFIGNAPGLEANSAELRLSSLPEEDSLVWASFPIHRHADVRAVPLEGARHAMVKAHIRRHLDAARASRASSGLAPRVLCEAGEGLEYVASSDSGIIGGYYDRMPPLSCANDSDVHFARHDAITMVYFLGPVHPEAPPMQLPYRMQACIGAYLVDDGSAHGDVSEYMANFRYQSLGHEPEFVFNYYVLNFILSSPADNLRRVLLVITSTTPVVSSGIVIVLLLCTLILCCCLWKLMCCSFRCFRNSTTAKKETLL
ncbi:hypothetical protein AB1Y20_011724 [Prymnesium parvum]|uniref:Transmembrane 9 superfamily member n=1 Tax=Prymnesium parvum TaxID=97485 RepID=A0AB34IJ71_PRYPA